MSLKIDKGIPIPGKRVKDQGVYGLIPKMCVGDSIFIPSENEVESKGIRRRVLIYCKKHFYKLKFTSRLCKENGIYGIRIWRVS